MADRRAGNRARDWADSDARVESCATCDASDHVASMYHGDSGLICAACFANDAGWLTEPEPTIWGQLVLPAVYLPLLYPFAVWISWGAPVFSRGPTAALDVAQSAWAVFFFLSLVYTPLLLTVLASRIREARRLAAPEGADLPLQEIVGHLWHGAVLVGIQALTLPLFLRLFSL